MLQTIEAMLEPNGVIHWLEKVNISRPTKILVTFLAPTNAQEIDNIEDLFGILTASQGVSLEAMDLAIRERVSQHDFD
ncbi:hypothetical protein [uncultured Thiothrix sp.]|uniref:hypothetical protein n=1 Tax=uncultured Thiothrix sp. TaxID=223185 RepID=UPI0026377BD9|nr:hypothetical protein [uncultured Thiothrix sp.]HMT93049.1 hypothetical protein [Thiolinea sp.]